MEFKENELFIIVHFGELWLKGRNRNLYIKKLFRNIEIALEGEDAILERSYDRFLIRLNEESNTERIKERLKNVFGISNYEVAYATLPSLESINRLSRSILAKVDEPVRIKASRSYKALDFNSVDITDKVRHTAKSLGMVVSSDGFKSELNINVTKDAAFISTEKIKGLGGLPVGTSGKGIILLSGGIDSPVAAWYAMKRGIEPIYLHLHAYPDNGEVLRSKIPKIIEVLSRYSPEPKVYYIPSHLFQLAALKTNRYELVLLKAFMLILAERIAERENANLIFTGESLGQVASQTAQNLVAESHGIRLPIIRPLAGFDKEEIISMAKRIGTYDYSILPYRDVCSINSRNPKTRARVEKVAELKRSIKLSGVANKSLKMAKIIEKEY